MSVRVVMDVDEASVSAVGGASMVISCNGDSRYSQNDCLKQSQLEASAQIASRALHTEAAMHTAT